jgi:hypothetical protein
MSSVSEGALRTRVYIDGYNLYYGSLKNTAHKWLDVRALVERILPSVCMNGTDFHSSAEFRTPAIKYFTAPILTSFARAEDSFALALHAFCDAVLGDIDQIVVMTNDGAPATDLRRSETSPRKQRRGTQMAEPTVRASRTSSAHRYVHLARECSGTPRLHEETRDGVSPGRVFDSLICRAAFASAAKRRARLSGGEQCSMLGSMHKRERPVFAASGRSPITDFRLRRPRTHPA